MDWDKKMPSWDFSEVDSNAGPNLGPMAGPSTGLSVRAQDGPLDLKLGGSSSSGSSSKRARAPGPGGGPSVVSCLVDGCIADLRNCREYHRRHKVCEAHSKTPIVMVRGQQQRFCQQCSRFHLLVEFDEGKRSCRKRLDGHNRRRRKPQPESINSGSLFANHQGNRFTSYSQTFTSTITDLSWSNTAIKSEDPPLYAYQQPVHFLDPPHHFSPSSFTPSFNLQDSDTSLCQSFKRSDCALSLLSSPPVPPPTTSSINQPPLLSYGGGLGLGQYSSGSHQALLDDAPESTTGFASSGMEGDENPTEMSCQVLFGEGSSDGGTQALPFSW